MNLKDIGLNEYETKVYTTLVQIGKSGSSKISAKSGVPYGRIYDILESLVKKGLVVIAPEKPKKYYAVSPNVIERLIDGKTKELEKLKEEVKTLERKYERFPEEVVWITKGKENFHRILRIAPEPKSYNYAIKWSFLYHPVWSAIEKRWMKKGIDVKTIGPFNEQTKENIKNWLKFEKIKEFPNEGVAIQIQDDDFVMIGLIKSDITILIKDKAFAEVMANLFRDTWKVRKEIKFVKI